MKHKIAALTVTGLIVLAALCLPPTATAHEHASGVVKERMDMMESMAKSMKAIGNRVKTRKDLGGIRADAENIKDHAAHLPALFPAGSMQHPTEAKDSIWKQFPDFAARSKALETASAALAGSEQDVQVLMQRVRAVADSCGGCHELYRIKKK